jgi:hypothetical protein
MRRAPSWIDDVTIQIAAVAAFVATIPTALRLAMEHARRPLVFFRRHKWIVLFILASWIGVAASGAGVLVLMGYLRRRFGI